MPAFGPITRRLCVAVDAANYSKGSDLDQAATQRGLVEVLNDAAEAAGLRRMAWHRQPAGDGELAVLPDGEPEALVVDRFVRELDAALLRYNLPRQPQARLHLRLAVHFGRLSHAANGFAGPAPITVSRLVNAELLRLVLRRCPDAHLAVLLSPQVFDDTVATLTTTLRPEHLRKVNIEGSKFTGEAWLMVPGHDVHTLSLDNLAGSGPAGGSALHGDRTGPAACLDNAGEPARAFVRNEFNSPVRTEGNAVFGIQLGDGR